MFRNNHEMEDLVRLVVVIIQTKPNPVAITHPMEVLFLTAQAIMVQVLLGTLRVIIR